jgi:YceI-like domain
MKNGPLVLTLILIPFFGFSQGKYFARDGKISFFSKGLIEDIEAHTDQASSIINLDNGDIVFSMLIQGFQFKKELMYNHFNENYLETDQFPKGVFKGKITNFDDLDLRKDGTHELELTGQLSIHGVTKEYSMPALLQRDGEKIYGTSSFKIRVADHNIKIPSTVVDNIAEVVDVTIEINYQPYKK